jgi:hypothetical protein
VGAAPGDEDAEDTEEDVREGWLSSSSATSTESHSRASADLCQQDSWKDDDSSIGVASSSGGAPSRDITDDELEDSDSENEALRSARAGGRRRRTRRVSVHVCAKMRRYFALKREFKESDLQFGVAVVACVVAVARFIIPSQITLSTPFITHSFFPVRFYFSQMHFSAARRQSISSKMISPNRVMDRLLVNSPWIHALILKAPMARAVSRSRSCWCGERTGYLHSS